jgi:4-azaleucine resistance transporter AzlC
MMVAAIRTLADHADWSELRRGALMTVPLWPGVTAFGVAFAMLARTSGFSALETQALSMLLFAGSAQLAIVTLLAGGVGSTAVLLTVLLLNLRHVLYGLSLNSHLSHTEPVRRPLLAFFMTDETYGMTLRAFLAGRGSGMLLLGAGLSLYVWLAATTLAGILFGAILPDPERIGLSFVFPLMFLALLVPLLTSWRAFVVAACSAGFILALRQITNPGVAFLSAVLLAVLIGAIIERHHPIVEDA